ncbi:hypothetical protein JZ751_025542 [Albula glossodonta]|uniref:Uncharacterized protein n=1 Tax=Albula glossodonta TaxID=121402 RepID=A0A8T2MWK5_9TELE|nr:hypothetical protein JZ751_025542 [Albula glossodonta]
MWAGQENRTAELQCLQCADSDPFIPVQCSHAANFLLGVPANSWVLWLMVQPAAAERGVLSGVGVFELHLTLSGLLFSLSSEPPSCPPPPSFKPCCSSAASPPAHSPCSSAVSAWSATWLCSAPSPSSGTPPHIHPLTFLRYRPLRYKVPMLAGVWLLTLLTCAVTLLLCLTPGSVSQYHSGAFFLSTLCLQSCCSLAILRALRRSGPGPQHALGPQHAQGPQHTQQGSHLAKRRAFRSVLFSQATFVVNYLPLTVTSFLHGTLLGTRGLCVATTLSFSASMLSSLLQPLRLLHRAGKLQCILGPPFCRKGLETHQGGLACECERVTNTPGGLETHQGGLACECERVRNTPGGLETHQGGLACECERVRNTPGGLETHQGGLACECERVRNTPGGLETHQGGLACECERVRNTPGGLETHQGGLACECERVRNTPGGLETHQGGLAYECERVRNTPGGLETHQGGLACECEGVRNTPGGLETHQGGLACECERVKNTPGGLETHQGGLACECERVRELHAFCERLTVAHRHVPLQRGPTQTQQPARQPHACALSSMRRGSEGGCSLGGAFEAHMTELM